MNISSIYTELPPETTEFVHEKKVTSVVSSLRFSWSERFQFWPSWKKLLLSVHSGTRWTGQNRPSTMRWPGRRRSSTFSCTQAGAPGTTTPFIRRRRNGKRRAKEEVAEAVRAGLVLVEQPWVLLVEWEEGVLWGARVWIQRTNQVGHMLCAYIPASCRFKLQFFS